jgi:predicted nucleic acid-binding protein
MIHLVLDTNILIYLAEGQHPFVLKGLINKIQSKDIVLLVNDEIIKEWIRNEANCKKRIKDELIKNINSSRDLSSFMEVSDSKTYKELLQKIDENKAEFIKTIDERFKVVNDLINLSSINVPIKDEHKLLVIDWALAQSAPFHRNKNSVADALILISSIDYIKENGINNINYNRIDVSDSIFVSYNSDDFSKDLKGVDKNIIHPDLQPLLDSVGMRYERNFGTILNLATDLRNELDKYIESVEDRIFQQMEWENEIKRGK